MATRTTSRMSALERREQLLDVAKAIVVDRGFHAVSMEAVAREAGVSRPIVYGHFRDLEGVLEALVEREGKRALMQLQDVLPDAFAAPDPRERLVASLAAYLEAVRTDPDTWRLVLMPQEGAPRMLHERIAQGRAAVVERLAAGLGPGSRGGPSPDPELTARMLSAFGDEAARLLLAEPERFPVERLIAHARWWMSQVPPM
jgi:AcrR family transcriptional regulator